MRLVSGLLLAISFMMLRATPAPVATDKPPSGKVYVCPMAEHPQEFTEPGTCPICGMELVEKSTRLRVAVLLFDDAEIIDYAAPFEVFGQVGASVFTVGATTAGIHSVFGLRVQPDFDLEHAPASDVLLVPGGGIDAAMRDEKVIAWIRDRAASSRYVLSVCNGAFLLAKAGLLDGLSATTTYSHIDELGAAFPKTHVVRDRRFVDNGKIITTAGLSAGLDGALHVVEREYGRARAEDVARGIEYNWQPDSKWARGNLADALLPDVHLPAEASWEKLASHGDTQQWEMRGRLRISMTPDEFFDYSAKQIVAKGWTQRESEKGSRSFVKTDRDGQAWIVTLASTADSAPSTFMETMTIRKVAGK